MKPFQHDHEADYAGNRWIFTGIVFGVVMCAFYFLLALISPDWNFTLKNALLLLPIWVLGGLAYGGIMKLYFRSRSKKAQ